MTMKTRLPLHLGLFAVLLAACAPAATPVTALPTPVVLPSQTALPTVESSLQPTTGPTEPPSPTVAPIATSRGPNLEATDPSTVSLAAGQLQLVEFFRFT
jgi:hypothetical protein